MSFSSRPLVGKDYLALTGFVVLSFLPALFGAQFRPGPWYAALRKPAWNPPGWIFGPVWTALYLLMGLAAWAVWVRRGWSGPLYLFLGQLFFNGLWSWLFFGWKSPALASLDLVLLWLSLAATVAAFWAAQPLAGALMLPYLAWATFATVLCFTLWRMNS